MASPTIPIVVTLGGMVLVVVFTLTLLKTLYSAKSYALLPARRPLFCFLPKYSFSVPLDEKNNPEVELIARIEQYGFTLDQSDEQVLKFTRGSSLGDFSIEIAKLIITAQKPVANPAELQIKYGVVAGCAFDTGDLWKFCRELMQKVEQSLEAYVAAEEVETGNPYQSPLNK